MMRSERRDGTETVQPIEYETMYRVEEHHWWYRALRRVLFYHIRRYLPLTDTTLVLDAGCGTGRNLAELARQGVRSVGVDRSPQAITFCRQRKLDGIVQADVCRLPFGDAVFHAVVSASVLYHVRVHDVRAALREARRVLQPGGLLFLDVPAYRWLSSAHDQAVHTARRFTRREIRRAVMDCGFVVRRLTSWNGLLLPAVWAARRLFSHGAGRDFGAGRAPAWALNELLNAVCAVEFAIVRCTGLPFGVSLACVAQRP